MDILWFEDKSGYYKNADPCNRREHAYTAMPYNRRREYTYTAMANINTNRALNQVDKLGLAELALAGVTCAVYHDVSVGSRLRERVAVCGIRSSRG